MNIFGKKRADAPAAEEQTETEKILTAAIARYLEVPADSIRLVSWKEHEEAAPETPAGQLVNTDGRERNDAIYRKDRWKSL